jgi:hypothetical protein
MAAKLGSEVVPETEKAVTAEHSARSGRSAAPRSVMSASMVSASRMAGTFRKTTRWSVSDKPPDGECGVLVTSGSEHR